MGPLAVVDFVAMTLFKMNFALKLDEWVDDNLEMALAAAPNTAGLLQIGITSISRQIKFVGANIYGPQWEVILPNCFIAAKETIDWLSNSDTETAQLPLSGSVLYDAGIKCFGTAQSLAGATGNAPIAMTPNILNYYLGTGNIYTAPVGT
ncbi:hypothetical protein JQ594_15560 [Bradyrhizobium manausense]|uniref:hypothetical protein n=1 Tax=Bradyrhizobium manausense TaxID=989370 RepID=UPI001BA94481|nr:hypothetical protein [Bradyrhizobium manausense]MBR0687348.1 hypothetical protein [Bradyrhizobium manausense]